MRRAAGWALLAGACAPGRDAFEDVPIHRAALRDFDLSSLHALVGTVQGDALLVWEGPGGAGELPVHLGGGSLGVAIDLTFDPEGHASDVPFDLSRVDDPTVGDVLGTYNGTTGAFAALVGVSRRRLRNGRGVGLREDHFALGLAIDAAFQWVNVRPRASDDDTADTGSPPVPADYSAP